MQSGVRLGPYEIVAAIGAGGMGEVYKARDTRLGRDVAIKVLPPDVAADAERLKRFEREAKATAALSHPNIIEIHDIGMHEGAPYLVEELLEGESLRERLGRGAIPVREAVGIATQVAHGLAAAHDKHIVHRDLKPENVFITGEGTVKILDFGLAKLVEGVPVEQAQTLTHAPASATEFGRVLGTMAYMAPEQARGTAVDSRADIFAFGVVLYEMLSGQRPFWGATATDTIAAILKEDPLSLPPSVPGPLAAVVMRCLAKEPGQRYQRASEVQAALEAAAPGSVAAPGPAWASASQRHRWILPAAAVVAIVAIVAIVAVVTPGGLRRLLGGAAAPQVRSLAVLPLENLSHDPEQDYFADGTTEELITTLAKIGALKVISRTSVLQYKGSRKPLPQIARELNVEAVIEGSVLREGGRVRITAQLIEASTDQHLWAESYERDLGSVLALQSEIARVIAAKVHAVLTPAERTRLASATAVNPEAYEACLKGRFHWYKLSRDELDTAERYFNAALESDPNYALAYDGLSKVWLSRTDAGFQSPAETIPQARRAAQRALELDDTVAETHLSSAFVKGYDRDWQGAEQEYRRAVELNPNSAEARFFYADFLVTMLRTDEWEAQIRRTLELDPLNFFYRCFYGWHLVYLRRYDEAIGQLNKVLSVEPDFSSAHMGLWGAFYKKGMDQDALAEAKKFFAVLKDREAVEALDRGWAKGGYRSAMRLAGEALAARSARSYVSAVRTARLFAHAGEDDRALDFLEKALGRNESALVHIGVGWDWDALRGNPRFKAILQRLNLPSE